MTMRIHSAPSHAYDNTDVHSTASHLSNVDELPKRNLRTIVIDEDGSDGNEEKETTNEDDSEYDEERGPPGTSVSAIESLVTKSDDALVAFRKAIAAEKAAAATKAA
ncbi:hypothetical protein PHMEG_00028325 [Phytophthora megakarya]|uniref:Uncharacterized protein n=1 Tax=Phytophthora megakarya TaxID=4795 RepID=A0A225V6V1_9STRA|nr:hypothetical protein PHMEG_00028325 [Phytophthora megakarya]